MHDGEKKDLTEGFHHRATTHVENLNGLNFQLSCNQRATDYFQVQSPFFSPSLHTQCWKNDVESYHSAEQSIVNQEENSFKIIL